MMNFCKIISWNVDGFRARYQKGQFIRVFDTDPDIVCIQETKTPINKIPTNLHEKIPGYTHHFSEVQEGSFAGVGIFSKKEPRDVRFNFDDNAFEDEGRILIAEYDEFTLLNIYFPLGAEPYDSLPHKLEFYDAFLNYVKKLTEKKRRVIVCGDFNIAHQDIDLINPEMTKPMLGIFLDEREKLNNLINSLYFADAFRIKHKDAVKYTRWPYQKNARKNNLGWRLDYFFVSENLQDSVTNCQTHQDFEGSDHCPISLELNLPI